MKSMDTSIDLYQFAVPYTLGALCSLAATFLLFGPSRQLKSMVRPAAYLSLFPSPVPVDCGDGSAIYSSCNDLATLSRCAVQARPPYFGALSLRRPLVLFFDVSLRCMWRPLLRPQFRMLFAVRACVRACVRARAHACFGGFDSMTPCPLPQTIVYLACMVLTLVFALVGTWWSAVLCLIFMAAQLAAMVW
jgi:hypothetical protein